MNFQRFIRSDIWVGTWYRTLLAQPFFAKDAPVRSFTESGEIRGERQDVIGALKIALEKACSNASRFDKSQNDFTHKADLSRAVDELQRSDFVEYQAGTYRLIHIPEGRGDLVECAKMVEENFITLHQSIISDKDILPSLLNRLRFLTAMCTVVAARLENHDPLSSQAKVAMGMGHTIKDFLNELDDCAGLSTEIDSGIQITLSNVNNLVRIASELT